MAEISFLFTPSNLQYEAYGLIAGGYQVVHDKAEADYDVSGNFPSQYKTGTSYIVKRIMLYTDTSSLEGKAIVSAKLLFKATWKNILANFDVTVVKGTFDYPLTLSAYGDVVGQIESRGTINTSSITAYQEYEIPLNSIGIAEINTAGMTKFCLRSSQDIAETIPSGLNNLGTVWAYYPRLIVMTREAGYIWVEGINLAYTDSSVSPHSLKRLKEGTTTGNVGIAGSLWVEGTNLHYIDASGNERYIEGTQEGATGKTGGHIWIGETKIRYIDSSGNERYFAGSPA